MDIIIWFRSSFPISQSPWLSTPPSYSLTYPLLHGCTCACACICTISSIIAYASSESCLLIRFALVSFIFTAYSLWNITLTILFSLDHLPLYSFILFFSVLSLFIYTPTHTFMPLFHHHSIHSIGSGLWMTPPIHRVTYSMHRQVPPRWAFWFTYLIINYL